MVIVESSFPWLTLLVVWPLLVGLAILALPSLQKRGRELALGASGIELAGVLAVAIDFNFSLPGSYQMAETHTWIPQFGISWALGINVLSLVMVVLAAALVPLVLLADYQRDADLGRAGRYAAWILVLEFFMVLIFVTRDLFTFYLAFEAMLIPLYFLIGVYGIGENRKQAALKLVIYSLVGGLVMLVGIISVPVLKSYAPDSFLYEKLSDGSLHTGSMSGDIFLFLTFFIAFAIKAPMFPVHTWLADAATAARPGTSTLLVGVLDKIGTYGMIVVCLNMLPVVSARLSGYIIVLAIFSILYGAFAALGSRNLLRLISFTSVSHFGFMVMAIFVGSAYALTGAMVYMVAHGVSIAALFLLAGFLIERGRSADINSYGGLQRVTPVLAGMFLMSGLASVALPGLSGFVPEYMILLGTWQVNPYAAAISVLSVVIAAVYILLPYQKIFTGPVPKEKKFADLNKRERCVLTPLLVAMVVLGVWAAPLVGTLGDYSKQVSAGSVVMLERNSK
ncbi:NADH-quinone oxidoreductase subunit M [Actinomycetaceae bacterium TAE3-ERU4]|nr:NADH-quinone oxidoreductase subunit M [Actinomycetaceae bacterium TAE3-ERU4]